MSWLPCHAWSWRCRNCLHLYVSVDELNEAMMLGLGDQKTVLSQWRDVSHKPHGGRSRHAKRDPASCCWLPCRSVCECFEARECTAAPQFRLQSKERPQTENKICGLDPKGSVLRPRLFWLMMKDGEHGIPWQPFLFFFSLLEYSFFSLSLSLLKRCP